ncbi:MAG TPA: nuclear transport factor 2 family protein [Polyangiaceae bacterium]
MMRNLGTFAALSLVGLVGCGGSQEPAAAPLAPPPVASVTPAPAPVDAKKEEPKPVPLTADQKLKFYQDGWAAFNAKDLAKFQAIVFADNASSEHLDMGPPLVGASSIIEQGIKPFVTAFPDTTGEVELTLLNGNTLVGLVLFRGTQTGTLMTPNGPVPPTGKKIGLYSAHIVELNDAGKAQKEIMADDGGTMAGQLGLMNMPHRKVVDTGWAEKPVVVASGSDGEKANVAAFTKEVEGFNKHDAASAMGTAADDIVFSEMSAPADRVGKKEALKGVEEMFKGFPDAKLDIKSVWGAGDYVVATGTWTGTNTGDIPSMKLKKTGKAVTQQFVEIDKFAAGKTKNIWLFSNGAAAAAQLGLMPPPGAPKGKDAKPVAAKPEAKPAAAKPEAAAKPAMKPAEPAMKAAAAPAAAAKPATPAK